jgi:nitrate/nitrite transporter NarK
VRPTTWRVLALAAAVGLVVGYLVTSVVENRRGAVDVVPWSAAVVLAAIGAGLVYTALHTRARRDGRNDTTPLRPLEAARLAVLGLASSRVGSAVGGGYLGYALVVAIQVHTDYKSESLVHSLVCVAAAVVIVVGALLLEHVLSLPEGDDPARPPGASRSA